MGGPRLAEFARRGNLGQTRGQTGEMHGDGEIGDSSRSGERRSGEKREHESPEYPQTSYHFFSTPIKRKRPFPTASPQSTSRSLYAIRGFIADNSRDIF